MKVGKDIMAQWNRNTVPKCKTGECSKEVLATIEKNYNDETFRRVVKAVYIPYHHCTTEDMGWNMYDGIPENWEYAEERDSWWIPEGWWEVCEYAEEYGYFEITDKVIAWANLPKPYEPKVKELYGGREK